MKKINDVCLKITVVRHASTKYTKQKPRILQGQCDVDIDEEGIEQAKALARRLKKEKFDIIYSSDLLRAKSTVEQILEYHKDVPVVYTHDLREQDVGKFQCMSWQKCKEILNERNISFEKALEETGEPSNKFYKRVVQFYSYLIDKYVIEANNIPTKTLSRSNTFYSLNELSITSFDDLSNLCDNDDTTKSNPMSSNSSYSNLVCLLKNTSLSNSSSYNNLSSTIDYENLKENLSNKQSQQVSLLENAVQNSVDLAKSNNFNSNSNSNNCDDINNNNNNNNNNIITRKFKMFHILIVTHGGFIKNLMKHLLEELKFKLVCDEQIGFPKNTGIYKFSIVNIKYRDNDHSIKDYKWKGKIELMNCVAHLALLTITKKKREKQIKKEEEERLKELKKNSNYLLDNICGEIPDDFPGSAPKKITNDDSSDDEDMPYSSYVPQPQDNYYSSQQFKFPSKSLGW
ncbi:phosphoglycerate mutase-like protein [Anaeromyces robustus]|uniref:Phosphoglycerate mutase-like protein n=1 Tax=Anaeromyces robustus TaxID=1754192 RepID=A0A1Y1X892_9FUNG|nr:phosphoglycerate mutase-like protein [Anaeromyces robustus]|eukprot:ORX81979.1 phosphoglycerate mutase-like protein [Anaeromyces robustus]